MVMDFHGVIVHFIIVFIKVPTCIFFITSWFLCWVVEGRYYSVRRLLHRYCTKNDILWLSCKLSVIIITSKLQTHFEVWVVVCTVRWICEAISLSPYLHDDWPRNPKREETALCTAVVNSSGQWSLFLVHIALMVHSLCFSVFFFRCFIPPYE